MAFAGGPAESPMGELLRVRCPAEQHGRQRRRHLLQDSWLALRLALRRIARSSKIFESPFTASTHTALVSSPPVTRSPSVLSWDCVYERRVKSEKDLSIGRRTAGRSYTLDRTRRRSRERARAASARVSSRHDTTGTQTQTQTYTHTLRSTQLPRGQGDASPTESGGGGPRSQPLRCKGTSSTSE